jgi:uncharacterized protein (DUF58 family)
MAVAQVAVSRLDMMRLLRNRIYFAFPGFIFAGVTLFVVLAAINSQSNLLFLCFGVMLGCLFLSAFISGTMLRRLEIQRVVADHAAAGDLVDIHYHITNHKRFWPSFAITITEMDPDHQLLHAPVGYCMHVSPRATQTAMARMVPRHRGILQLKEIRLSCAFPFGFVNRVRYVRVQEKIIVYPRMGKLQRQVLQRAREAASLGTMHSATRGGHDEFFGLREYRPGDAMRSIHWRRTARTGQLLVRELTSNVVPRIIVLLDLHELAPGTEGINRAERGIELAASIIGHAFHENFAVGLLLPGLASMELTEPRMGVDQRRTLLGTLATLSLERVATAEFALSKALRKSNAQWIVISLSKPLELDQSLAGTATWLSLDDPESDRWLTFLEPLKPMAATVAPEPKD